MGIRIRRNINGYGNSIACLNTMTQKGGDGERYDSGKQKEYQGESITLK